MAAQGRIRFPKNPWPKGHALQALEWTGRIDPELGLFFDLHAESVGYSAEVDFGDDDDDDDIDDSWKSPSVWKNYHQCTLSSTMWGGHGVHVADEKSPLDFSALDDWTWCVDDSVAADAYDDHSFHIYLLGHDTALRHRVHFTHIQARTFTLKWTAKVALTYAGSTELSHSLVLESDRVTFGGFRIPTGVSAKEARDALARFTTGRARYSLRRGLLIPRL